MLQIEGLSKGYGSKQVLTDISISFEPGKAYGIVGENGAGKTTFFKCITSMESYRGTIVSSLQPLKDHIGYLPTEPYFFSKITGREYIQFVCNARGKKLGNTDSKNIFDLPLHQYATTYSTGMKKKLALTAILLQQNQYYLLDEPFNGVDIQSNVVILEILQRLKALGKTLLLSSHIFSTLSAICDEICLLKEGQFIRRVDQPQFDSLEQEMKQIFVGNKIDRLELT